MNMHIVKLSRPIAYDVTIQQRQKKKSKKINLKYHQ